MNEARKFVVAALGAALMILAEFAPGLAGTVSADMIQAAAALITPALVWLVPNVARPGMGERAENVAELAREALELRRRAAILLAAGATSAKAFADLPGVQRAAAQLAGPAHAGD